MVRTAGILALQGNFALHQKRLTELGANSRLVADTQALSEIDGLIIPGGESTTMLRLASEELRREIVAKVTQGMPLLATCAGLILVAARVKNPEQESLQLLDVEVTRNAYGRQVDSFIDSGLRWTTTGEELVKMSAGNRFEQTFEGVFIRAPRIVKLGPSVEVLVRHKEEAVLVKARNILGATFHPELSDSARAVHQLFLNS